MLYSQEIKHHTMKYKTTLKDIVCLTSHMPQWVLRTGTQWPKGHFSGRGVHKLGPLSLTAPLLYNSMVKSPRICSLPPHCNGLILEVGRWQDCSKKELEERRWSQLKAVVAAALVG